MLGKLVTAMASVCAIAVALVPVPAHASASQESVFQDDRALTQSGDARRQRTLDELKSLGVSTIHALVFWDLIAPQPRSLKRPAGFNARDPEAYPLGAWTQYDSLVSEAQARGLQLILTPIRGPAWAGRCGAWWIRGHCNPSPAEYEAFVEALGRRYPTVKRWSFWNEPNQARALQPQQVVRHGRLIPQAAVIYRNLLRAGVAGLKASGHGGDQVLLGETAPLGQRTQRPALRSLPPVAFYQGVFCLDSRGRSLRGQLARDEGCSGRYAPLPVSGVAHHPYTRAGSQPPTWRGASDEITLASMSRLSAVIAQGVRAHRLRSGLPFFSTEFGFQTNPPDHFLGVSLAAQARYIDQADWMSYRNGRIRSVAQYELFDDRAVGGFQSGLRFSGGRAKPALAAYRLPIWVSRARSGVQVWGQVRPAAGTLQTVKIENGFRRFKVVRTVHTSALGYLNVRIARQAGPNWRLVWTSAAGQTFSSRIAGVS